MGAATQRIVIASCPICGDNAARKYAQYPQMTWVKCACGLIYRHSQLDETESPAPVDAKRPSTLQARYGRREKRRVQKARHQILDALNHIEAQTLLDIGCSAGYTLMAGQSLGLKSTGVDLNPLAIERALQAGLDARIGSLNALPVADGYFDLVTAKHVLEHTVDPRGALREIRRVLKPGGAAFIAVPHASYIKASLAPQSSRFYLPQRNGHFVYYRPQTLQRLLAEEGFMVVKVHPHLLHRHTDWPLRLLQILLAPMRWVAQKLAQLFRLRKEFWVVALRR